MDNIALTQPDVRYLEPPLLSRNVGGKFVDVSAQSGAVFKQPYAARGVAFGDINNDGFVDLAIGCNDGSALLLKNGGNSNHWLIVKLEGTRSNRDGIGARVSVITSDGKHQYAMASTASSYLSASDKRVYFGLASAVLVKRLEIQWPSGIRQSFCEVHADQIFMARERTKP